MTSLRHVAGRFVRRVRRPRPWHLPPPGRPDDSDWASAAAAGRPVVYERLRRALVSNTVSPSCAEGFAALGIAGHGIDGSLGRLDGPQREAAVGELYARLMGIADPEVLLSEVELVAARGLAEAGSDRGPGSHLAWRWAYAAEAAAVTYGRTADERFAAALARMVVPVLDMRDGVVGRMDDCLGRIGAGWSSAGVIPGRLTTNVTLAGRIAEPLAHLAALAGRSPALAEITPAAAEAARAAVDDLEERYVPLDGAGYYRVACGDRAEPLNHVAAFGAALLRLNDAVPDDRLVDRATALARWFTSATFRDRNGRLVWRYDPKPARPRGRGPEHVWKAQVTIHFVVLAVERGLLEGAMLDEVRATLLGNVFRPDGPAATIEADREPLSAYRGVRGGAASLLPLTELGGEVAGAVERLVAVDLGMGGWFARPHGLLGYAYRLGD